MDIEPNGQVSVESQSFLQKQKFQSLLFSLYNKALYCLKDKKSSQGIEFFEQILQSPTIEQAQMRKLKKSVLLSMANVMSFQKDYDKALGYYFYALEIQKEIISDEQENFNPNTTLSIQYTTLLKMYELTEKMSYSQQSIYLLKRALQACPDMWRNYIIQLLRNQYKKNNMAPEIQDLNDLCKNQTLFNKIISAQQKNRYRRKQSSFHHLNAQKENMWADIKNSFDFQYKKSSVLPALKILVKNQNSNGTPSQTSYSHFEYVLQVCYILLKCQRKRNFNKKRYLHKKYQSSNTVWHQFLQEFDVIKTKLQIVFESDCSLTTQEKCKQGYNIEKNQNQENSKKQNKQQQNEIIALHQEAKKVQIPTAETKKSKEQEIKDLATELLRIRYTKKKKNKNKNKDPVGQNAQSAVPIQIQQQDAQINHMQQQKQNKKYQYQQKQSYDSIKNYLKQNSEKCKFQLDQLQWLSGFSSQAYNTILKSISEDTPEEEEDQDNSEENSIPSNIAIANKLRGLAAKQENQSNKVSNKNNTTVNKNNNLKQAGNDKKINLKDKRQLHQQKIEFQNSQFIQFLQSEMNSAQVSNISPNQMSEASRLNSKITIYVANVCQLVQRMVKWILKRAQSTDLQSNSNERLSRSVHLEPSVKALAAKCILKIMPLYGGYFTQFYMNKSESELSVQAVGFVELLISHYLYMSAKSEKHTDFTPHQKQKVDFLKRRIIKSFQITVKLLDPVSNCIKRSSILSMWSKQLLIFFMTKDNYNSAAIKHYKGIILFYNKLGTKILQQLKQTEQVVPTVFQQYLQTTSSYCIEILMMEMSKTLVEQNISIPFIPKASSQDDLELLIKILQSSNLELHQEDPIFQRLIGVLQKYFSKLQEQSKSMEQFSIKFLQHTTQKFKIGKIISSLYGKFTNASSGIAKCFQKNPQRHSILFYLIKLCLLCPPSLNNDDCLRIIFFLTNLIFKGQNFSSHEALRRDFQLYKIIILYSGIIQYCEKRQRLENRNTIIRKFYQNVISKNLSIIYCDSFEEWKVVADKKKLQLNQNLPTNSNKAQTRSQVQDINLQEQRSIYLDKVMDIINGIYFGTQFTPKKLEDSVGFFLFLSRNYSDQFRCQQLQLATKVIKVFKKCYDVFAQRRKEIFKYCEQYQAFLEFIDKVWDGQQKETQQMVEILQGKKSVCKCCIPQEFNKKFNYKEVIYILAKFFESHAYEQSKAQGTKNQDSPSSPIITRLDQQFYKEYLLLDLKNPQAWINYIRIQCLKSYLYFDSLVGPQPLECFKNKFLFTKRIINFVRTSILEEPVEDQGQRNQKDKDHFKELKYSSIRTLNFLNILKVKERQFFMVLKKIQTNFNKEQSKDLVKKYQDGLNTISSKYNSLDSISSIYLGLSELIFVEVRLIQLGPKKLDALVKLIKKVKLVILELQKHEKIEYSVHLEQDLVVQLVILISKTMQKILQKIENSIVSNASIHQQELNGYKLFIQYCVSAQSQIAKHQKYHLKFQQFSTANASFSDQQDFIQNNAQNIAEQSQQRGEMICQVERMEVEQDQDCQESEQRIKQKQFKFQPLENFVSNKGPKPEIQKQRKSKTKLNMLQYLKGKILLRNQGNNLNNMQLSPKVTELAQFINRYFNAVCTLFRSLPRFQSKKFQYRRSVTTALQYASNLYLKYYKEPSVSLQIIKDYYNIRLDDIVFVYTHSRQKVSTEKNVRLSEFYNRSLIHNLHRLNFIQHLINCFTITENLESLILIIRKLGKMMMTGNGVGVPADDDNKEIKYLLLMYWVGVDSYLLLVQRLSESQALEQRFERLLKEFQNRIKKSIQARFQAKEQVQNEKDAQQQQQQTNELKAQKEKAIKENYYFQRIDTFIKSYEEKYERKVKLKKTKKQRQQEKQAKQKEKEKEQQKQQQQHKQQQQQRQQPEQINGEIQMIKQQSQYPVQKNQSNPQVLIQEQIQISICDILQNEENTKRKETNRVEIPLQRASNPQQQHKPMKNIIGIKTYQNQTESRQAISPIKRIQIAQFSKGKRDVSNVIQIISDDDEDEKQPEQPPQKKRKPNT